MPYKREKKTIIWADRPVKVFISIADQMETFLSIQKICNFI